MSHLSYDGGCETIENMEAYYVRHIKKAEGFTLKGFTKIMAQ
jgi:hypothetical protein